MTTARVGVVLAAAGAVLCVVALLVGEPAAVLPGLAAVVIGLVLRRS
ncbi:MAG TPA: hypothetical protein VD926_10060 [Acidimicrobiales bacterium]|nr:hypothetical protein [Acidimicrobiales bacterium]